MLEINMQRIDLDYKITEKCERGGAPVAMSVNSVAREMEIPYH